ncbi:hypothetical protein GA0070558_13322 [Micromonospora haikouensis]|uniref:Uncharacterized protein n=1 Tax=Micromonospora haikouensis TaxID=686309 RepID=A0A1C4Y115_9ACTN|nr:hypothetical protein GA0070558_13322 [Micromonospora haikouensis]
MVPEAPIRALRSEVTVSIFVTEGYAAGATTHAPVFIRPHHG